ncbi:MAG: hypothetical protein LUF78_07215 [Clostridiales bacterium]|nr:hypothetical protein [Clostridiales bacterium]
MKKKKVLSLLLAGLLTLSVGGTAYASTLDDQIASAQAEKAAAESELAATQSTISSLESKKQELQTYLSQLEAQYDELTETISQLSTQAAEKEEELTVLNAQLEAAKQTAAAQYEAMKTRIVYLYEQGSSSTLEILLSSENLADFINKATNIAELTQYDREKLEEYEALQESIAAQEAQAEQEAAEIDALLTEKSAAQAEVQTLAATTSDSIVSYVNEISASQAEASQLMAEISSAQSSITALVAQAEAEAAAQAAAAAAAAEAEAAQESASGAADYEDDSSGTQETYSEDTYEEDSYSEDTYEDETYSEETYEEDSSESAAAYDSSEDYTESDTSDTSDTSGYDTTDYTETTESTSSSTGTYLGNFKLTAYCNCAICCGTAGNLTASGTTPTAGRTVAMAGVAFGTKLSINGTIYTVEDLGTPYGHVDIYFDSHAEALAFGLQYADVYLVS